MNKVLLPAALGICLTCLANRASAQANQGSAQAPYDATIVTPTADVRSGPSLYFYVTSHLKQGEHVQVVRPAGEGWLCIVPPPGSFSYVETRMVDHRVGNTVAVVTAQEAPIRIASTIKEIAHKQPTVEGARVKRGTQLVVIGMAKPHLSDWWLPIQPTQGEVRYIPVTAVEKKTVVKQSSPPQISVPADFSQPRFGSTSSSDALLAQAQQAEREGRDRDAEALYDRVAQQVKATNYPMAVQCLNRIEILRDRQRAADSLANRQVPATPASNHSPYPPPYVPASSQYCYQPDPCRPVQLGAPPVVANASPVMSFSTPPPPLAGAPASAQPAQSVVATPVAQWYEPGTLERTPLPGPKKIYRLTPLSGRQWFYVSGDDMTNLEPYVNRTVSLQGEMGYDGTLRNYYLRNVRQVSQPQ